MKKLQFLLVFLLVIASMVSMISPITVVAAQNTYYLNKLGLKIAVPSGYEVITRDTPANDAVFKKFGTTKAEILSQFESSNIYLNAVSDTHNEEIVVTMTEGSISDFNVFSETELNALASTLPNQYKSFGFVISKYEIYQHPQAKFIILHFTDSGNTVHGLQYYTVYDGKAMNFTMRSYEGSLSSRQKTAIKTVVESIKYDKEPPIADIGEETKSFVYTDADSGVTFTVPKNWKEEKFVTDVNFLDVKFSSTIEDGCVMIFGSNDVWEQMPASEKTGYTRSDFNNSALTKADIAEIYNTTADKISLVSYGGIQYYKGEHTASKDVYGLDFSLTMTTLLRIENGWMYMFQFGGTSSHRLYSDFEILLNGVQYPTNSNALGVGSLNNTMSDTYSSDDAAGIIAIVVLLLIVAVIVIAVAVLRKKNAEKRKLSIYEDPTVEPLSNSTTTVTCENCGQALPLDSAFCHICGTKVNKGDKL